jgi:ABC-type Na+ efflux pump permease subunit
MVGPVLFQEMLLGGRRNQLHVFRWFYAAWLVLVVLWFYTLFQFEELGRGMRSGFGPVNRASAPEVVGGRFTESFVRQQMVLLLLVTPAFVAGAITDEKRRGTLQYLMLTDMEARHLVLGKLLGRMAQVVLVALGGLPMFALLAGFAGIAPVSLLATAAVLVLPLFGLAAATMLASVYCRQTRDAVLAVYAVGALGALAVWLIGGPFNYLNPTYVLAPAWGPSSMRDLPEAGHRLLVSSLAWGLLGGACLGTAALRLHPVYVRELESLRPDAAQWFTTEREPVSDDPVLWRERNVEGLAPNPTLRRVPQWLAIALVATLTTASSLFILYQNLPAGTTLADVLRPLLQLNLRKVAGLLPDATSGFMWQGVVALVLASLVVGIRCSGSITSERERQTWEAVLLTPLSAKQVVRAKLWGVLSSGAWYLLAYAAPALTLSALGGLTAFFITLICLAVTVLCMYFIGAAGVWCSVSSRNSWRALLATMLTGYLGGIALILPATPGILVMWLVLRIVLGVVDTFLKTSLVSTFGSFRLIFTATCITLAVGFFLVARWFLYRAHRWIADRERTRHWHEEQPSYRRSRRRASAPPVARET